MLDIPLVKLSEAVGRLEHYTVKTAMRESISKRYLREADIKSSIALIMAMRNLYGIDFLYWEPETITLTLKNDDIELSDEGMDKLMAGVTIIHNPAFFWDNLVFQRTTQAFNNVPYDPETLQECNPAHMAWAVYEATLLRGLDPEDSGVPEIDEDVQQYVAVCLMRAGFVCPPTVLSDVSENLKKMLPKEAAPLIEQTKKSWNHLDKEALQDRVFPEDPLGIQLSKLAAAYLYERRKAGNMSLEVLELEKGI